MILSMTGYGKSVAVFNGKKINVEIKSLNSKALDLSTRIDRSIAKRRWKYDRTYSSTCCAAR